MELIILIVFIAIIVFLTIKIRKKIKNFLTQQIFKKGRKGEENAVGFLKSKGFTILETQYKKESSLKVNGIEKKFFVKIDYICSKNGQKYLVEVKTGKQAPNPLYTPTRRQLFEYLAIYDINKIILLDMESKKINEIEFN